MLNKKKLCAGPCKKEQFIYKRINGKPYCKNCAFLTAQPNKKLKQTKPINKRSSKKIKEDQEYTKLRKKYLEQHPKCELNIANCSSDASEIHHTRYRGKYYLDVATWKAACHNCHEWCHSNPIEAKKLGFLIAIK